jgi:hypothetical protein
MLTKDLLFGMNALKPDRLRGDVCRAQHGAPAGCREVWSIALMTAGTALLRRALLAHADRLRRN